MGIANLIQLMEITESRFPLTFFSEWVCFWQNVFVICSQVESTQGIGLHRIAESWKEIRTKLERTFVSAPIFSNPLTSGRRAGGDAALAADEEPDGVLLHAPRRVRRDPEHHPGRGGPHAGPSASGSKGSLDVLSRHLQGNQLFSRVGGSIFPIFPHFRCAGAKGLQLDWGPELVPFGEVHKSLQRIRERKLAKFIKSRAGS